MISPSPIWISEREVVALISLSQAIDALEAGLLLQANGAAHNMDKALLSFGDGNTLHAIGAVFEGEKIVGTKTWVHTHGGATPLLLLWDGETGALRAVIEAFALGQMRTGGISGVATRWMSDSDANCLAVIGTGKQALPQLAAVAAVRRLRNVRVWGRNSAKRSAFAKAASALGYDFEVQEAESVEEAVREASIITLVTRAKEPFLKSEMVAHGAHINAVGAIALDREEFEQEIFQRTSFAAADAPQTVRKLSREFQLHFANDENGWSTLRPLNEMIGLARREKHHDISIFKAMGMGISDLALATEILRRANAANIGRFIEAPEKVMPRLH